MEKPGFLLWSVLALVVSTVGCWQDDPVFGGATPLPETGGNQPNAPQTPTVVLPPATQPPVVIDDFDPARFVHFVDHPYLPLVPGTILRYEGTAEGDDREFETTVLAQQMEVRGVICTGLMSVEIIDGEISEHSVEWYAQDVDGNVWQFGEETIEYDDTGAVYSEDSWVAEGGGMRPIPVLFSEPEVGDQHEEADIDDPDLVVILSTTDTVSTPVGTFDECLKTADISQDDPTVADFAWHARGVGLVKEDGPEDTLQLIEIIEP